MPEWLVVLAKVISFIAGLIGGITVIWKFFKRPLSKALNLMLSKALQPVIERLTRIENQQQEMNESLATNNLQTARLDLNQAICHTPHEHKAIMDLAWNYFVVLQGDAWMSGVFQKWAKDEGVDIGYISAQSKHLKD